MNLLNVGISETIRDHLTKQMAQAGYQPEAWTREDGKVQQAPFQCRYRDDSGRMCAIGVLLLPDSAYSAAYEGCALVYSDRLFNALDALYPGVDRSMLQSWQGYHDGEQYKAWCEDPETGTSPGMFHLKVVNHL